MPISQKDIQKNLNT